jgi:hypothetical protein
MEVKISNSNITLFLAAALQLNGTFIQCQQENLAFIRVGIVRYSADRVDSIHVIPTVLRCFNDLLFFSPITQATLIFSPLQHLSPVF